MPRKGHKDGCQCVVCKAMKAKLIREAMDRPDVFEPVGRPTLGSLLIGAKFRHQNGIYQKINDIGANAVVINPGADDQSFLLNQRTVVDPIKPGHNVEADM